MTEQRILSLEDILSQHPPIKEVFVERNKDGEVVRNIAAEVSRREGVIVYVVPGSTHEISLVAGPEAPANWETN